MAEPTERLVLRRTLPGGRVLAVNAWATGFQELVFTNRESFERAKEAIEQRGATVEFFPPVTAA